MHHVFWLYLLRIEFPVAGPNEKTWAAILNANGLLESYNNYYRHHLGVDYGVDCDIVSKSCNAV